MIANLLYLLALLLASPVIAYRAIRHGRYRRGVRQKLFGLSRRHAQSLIKQPAGLAGTSGQRCIWIHAVSVGEVNLVVDLVERLKQARPDCSVVISSSTDTGFDLALKRFGADCVFFCPLDFSWAVRRTLKHLQPEQLVLVELELWPNLIRLAKKSGCQVSVINARLSERSAARYQAFALWLAPTFARLDWVGCQDVATRDRFAACSAPPESLQVTGSLKFDNAPICRDNSEVQSRAQWSGVDPWHRVWIVGSTQRGEEAMALAVYQALRSDHPQLRLILVPRHQERFDEVAALVSKAGLSVHRRSCDYSLHKSQWSSQTVILGDTIGELRHWWGVGQIATVGGSFGDRGGQNMLEPAGYGSAVSFGPNTRNFKPIAEALLAAGGAVRVADAEALEAFVRRCLNDIPAADDLGRRARQVVIAHRGATDRTLHGLCRTVAKVNPTQRAA